MSLPSFFLIAPSVVQEKNYFITLEHCLQQGIKLLMFRTKGLAPERFEPLAIKVLKLARRYQCQVLFDADAQRTERLGADGIYLDSYTLEKTQKRPIEDSYLVAASCHTLEALKHAEILGANFALLSPVLPTKSHADLEPLGWEKFGQFVSQVSIPVFAFGGVSRGDEEQAIAAGGQGVAGSRGYWQSA